MNIYQRNLPAKERANDPPWSPKKKKARRNFWLKIDSHQAVDEARNQFPEMRTPVDLSVVIFVSNLVFYLHLPQRLLFDKYSRCDLSHQMVAEKW